MYLNQHDSCEWRNGVYSVTSPYPVELIAELRVCFCCLQSVHMAHALRRISYATCDPEHAQFSFLAREPKGHFSLQYCHSFLAQSADQVSDTRVYAAASAGHVEVSTLPSQAVSVLRMCIAVCFLSSCLSNRLLGYHYALFESLGYTIDDQHEP
jgi:hypothetical protein